MQLMMDKPEFGDNSAFGNVCFQGSAFLHFINHWDGLYEVLVKCVDIPW